MNCNVDISIIVPVYNAEKTLDQCLRSLCVQTYENIEVIVINDGSTDLSQSIIEKYKATYSHIISSYNISNSGVWRARKFGISKANGKYIGFCDSDDFVIPTMFEKMYVLACKENAEMVICSYNRIFTNVKGKVIQEMKSLWENLSLKNPDNIGELARLNTSLWNKLTRADLIKGSIDFLEPPRIAEDMMLLASVYPKLTKVAFINEPLYQYMVYPHSAMHTISEQDMKIAQKDMLETKRNMLNQNQDYGELADLLAFIHIGISLPLGLISSQGKNIRDYLSDIRKYLNLNYCSWKHSKYLNFSYCIQHGMMKIKIVNIIYKLYLFPIFISIYCFILNKTKINVKW